MGELIAEVFPCKETFAALPPALSRGSGFSNQQRRFLQLFE